MLRALRLSVLTLALLALPGAIWAQGTIYPGQTGSTLLSSLYSGYSPASSSTSGASTLGYDNGRDVLYGTIYPQIQGERTLTCVYTGFKITLAASGDPSSDAFSKGINTEHTWPQGTFSQSEPMRSDLHHLYPTREDVNNARGSDPFADIPDAQTTTWYRLAASQSSIPTTNLPEWSEDTGAAFEPREDHKGDVARALFYFRAMYPSVSWSDFEGMKATLRQWHQQDPADAFETARSNAIAQHQGDPNPFIDDATLVERAFFPGSGGAQTATVAFSSATASVGEGASANIVVRLTTSDGAALGSAASGSVTLTPGTATSADFSTSFPQGFSFAAGAASGATATISVGAVSDDAAEGSETATLGLGSLSGATAASPSSVTLTVTEPGTPGGSGSSTFVISQFQAGGSSSADDEFVELLNVSNADLDLNGHALVYRSASGTSDVVLYSFTATRIIPAKRFLLLARSAYNGTPAADLIYSGGSLSGSGGGLALRNASNALVDAVAYGTASTTHAFIEGTKVSAAPASEGSLIRLNAGLQDTDHNQNDFTALTTSTPRNAASAALPVELTRFTATVDGAAVLLRWETASETNNAGFAVEQHEGATWRTLGTVAGRGTTSEHTSYAFPVRSLTPGTYRFRLRQTDFDGTTSYSPTVEAFVQDDAPLRLHVQGSQIVVRTQTAQPVRVEAFDLLGRRVAVLLDAQTEGQTPYRLELPPQIAPGTYVVRATGVASVATRTLVVR